MVQVLLNRVIYLFYFDICNFVVAKIASRIQALCTHSIGTPRTFLRTIAECNEVFRMTLVLIKKTFILYWYVHEKGLSSARISSAKSLTRIVAGNVRYCVLYFHFHDGILEELFYYSVSKFTICGIA